MPPLASRVATAPSDLVAGKSHSRTEILVLILKKQTDSEEQWNLFCMNFTFVNFASALCSSVH